jgi:rhamnogalacturonan endolyase
MKFYESTFLKKATCYLVCLLVSALVLTSCSSSPRVILTDDAETYTMDNGIVKVRISKVTGDLVSFRYQDKELLATQLSPEPIPAVAGGEPEDNPNWRNPAISGHAHGYWSHDVMGVKGSAPAVPSVTIDPAKNGGKRAEISLKAISNGRKMGTGPGAAPDGNVTVDIEIRYALERDASGVYTYSIFRHQADYPLTQFTEARYCAKLAPFFDWISVDKDVNHHYPKEHFAGDKYVYTANQSENPAFGWSSTTEHTGLFFINPSMEYMGGGPTKVEFLGHRDTNEEAAPCVLNYWRSSHYGGAEVNIAAGETWEKIIGPMLIYANTGDNPQAIYEDAKKRAAEEIAKWPYEWLEGVDYPKAAERATVSGRIILNEPDASATFRNLNAGLTAGEYRSPRQEDTPPVFTGWQRDAKFYQFWTKGNADGTFEIANVRPGKYTLYAFADGILGEFVYADIIVEPGKALQLGELNWTPVRKGRMLWEIGIPNRNASEFFMAEKRRDPEISLEYARLFPEDITYVIGQSNFANDWFFQHVPHNEDPEAKSAPFFGVRAIGRITPRYITFDLPEAPVGTVHLRIAICGTGTQRLAIEVNGKPTDGLENLSGDGVITRHGSQGIWYEKDVTFNASLLHAGKNTLTLTVPSGPVNNGLMYDYLRLELSD